MAASTEDYVALVGRLREERRARLAALGINLPGETGAAEQTPVPDPGASGRCAYI
jgi:hypothetical protein